MGDKEAVEWGGTFETGQAALNSEVRDTEGCVGDFEFGRGGSELCLFSGALLLTGCRAEGACREGDAEQRRVPGAFVYRFNGWVCMGVWGGGKAETGTKC